MGLSHSGVKFILSGRHLGMKLDSVCTLGRQNLFLKPGRVHALLSEYKCCPQDFWTVYPSRDSTPLVDPLFRILGSTRIDSLDNSTYEGANVIHDMNMPLPDALKEQYDLVVDGGTLEHVFFFPTALENAMKLVKPGGHLMLMTPANGLCGHGFYQFSPELFFRVLSPQYGFELLRLYIGVEGKLFHVVDPVLVHGRVELRKGTASLYVHARKIGDCAGLSTPTSPQQSDYVTTWASHERDNGRENSDGKLKAFLRARLSPSSIESISRHLNQLRFRRVGWRWKRAARPSNRQFYIPVTDWSVATRDVTGGTPAN